MPIYKNLARMKTTTTGTGTITLTTAVDGCKTFADAGCSDSGSYEYGIITYDTVTHRPTGSECGLGKYIESGTTFQRTTVYNSTDSDDSAIDLTGLSEIYLGPVALSYNAGFNPFSNYRQDGTATTVADATDNAVLDMDIERIDTHGISSLDSDDVVTINEPGWYTVEGFVTVTAGLAWNGYINVFHNKQALATRGIYATADAITNDSFLLPPTLIEVTTTTTVNIKLNNHSGQSVTATVRDLTIRKVAEL